MAKAAVHSALAATIITYDATTDTCTCELTGAGAFDAWVAGCKLAAAIDRAYAVNGALVTLDSPDPARLCDFTVIAITNPGSLVTETTAGQLITQTGTNIFGTDASGHMAIYSVAFPVPFSAVPTQVNAGGPDAAFWVITSITASGFNVTLRSGTYAPNTGFMLTWSATGNQ